MEEILASSSDILFVNILLTYLTVITYLLTELNNTLFDNRNLLKI